MNSFHRGGLPEAITGSSRLSTGVKYHSDAVRSAVRFRTTVMRTTRTFQVAPVSRSLSLLRTGKVLN